MTMLTRAINYIMLNNLLEVVNTKSTNIGKFVVISQFTEPTIGLPNTEPKRQPTIWKYNIADD